MILSKLKKIFGNAPKDAAEKAMVDHLNKKGVGPKVFYHLPEGYLWNPLNKYPQNRGCFCGSGVKAKRCCIPVSPRILLEDHVLLIKKHWSKILTGHVTLPPAPGRPTPPKTEKTVEFPKKRFDAKTIQFKEAE